MKNSENNLLRQVIKVHNDDNVAVAISTLAQGTILPEEYASVILSQEIPKGHKLALQNLKQGDDIVKYGFVIGQATADIAVGSHIHSHNLSTKLNGSETYHYDQEPTPLVDKTDIPTFKGYVRKNGKVGIRNDLWIINTVGCVNQSAKRITDLCKRQFEGRADEFVALTHPFGCSQLGDDLSNTRNLLSSLMQNPNAGGVLVIGLGCENNQLSTLMSETKDIDSNKIRYFNSQEVDNEIEVGLKYVEELLNEMDKDVRTEVPVSQLTLGMKCGGSDGFSGLTANPVVGRVTDMLTQYGGRVILTETPEMFGAEQVLMDRAYNKGIYTEIVNLVQEFKDYFIRNNQPIYENPSPGNKAGGLTTLEEKSLGAIQKGGKAIINEVIDYGKKASTGKGLTLLQAPGNDAVSSTALSAAGANIILFTTGRGTPLGFPVPTVKISSNTDLATRKKHWIDFDSGQILTSDMSIDECAEQLFSYLLRVASGEKTNNEINDNREISIWKNGVTL
ncbi:altronate dehydratase family protein [Colwellia sp. UCD-KL20]|uniref:UxaA family hydrolase n=1 Tax=Colwellia sp. UCD-KL20 TaxID=1917165 RepID=UPI0009FA9B5B|nr:altronate dehydratase family protein [Colwellia sp. UCD-KL20]